jgi:hypothetical protein
MIINEQTKSLARDVVDYIEAHPESHEQAVIWGVVDYDEEFDSTNICDINDNDVPDNICGTVMCIAGTAAFIHGGIETLAEIALNGNWEERAGELLGLNFSEASILFYTMDESKALDATRALADGNEDKFKEILGSPQRPNG